MVSIVWIFASVIFWACLSLMAWTLAGYPAALALAGRFLKKPHRIDENLTPTLTLIIPAHNEAVVIGEKLDNSLALDYPSERLQILVVCDGCEDETEAIVARYADRGIKAIPIHPRQGKQNGLNTAVQSATGEILILCDANVMFQPDAPKKLVRHFADPQVGCVSGDVRLGSEKVSYGKGEGAYYRLERFVQRCEGDIWSAVGVDGGMYTIRRSLFEPNPPDTLCDDLVIAMKIACSGRRVLYEPEAVANEDAVEQVGQELRRRLRTTAGGMQALRKGWGVPSLRQPGLCLRYVSHKLLRWMLGWLMIGAFAGNVALVLLASENPQLAFLYRVTLIAQTLFALIALIGWMFKAWKLPRIICLPFYLVLTASAALIGSLRSLPRQRPVPWARVDRTLLGSGRRKEKT